MKGNNGIGRKIMERTNKGKNNNGMGKIIIE